MRYWLIMAMLFWSGLSLAQPVHIAPETSPNVQLTPDESANELQDTGNTWVLFVADPTILEYAIYVGMLVILGILLYLIYRAWVAGYVNKGGHPANFRSLLYLLWIVLFLIWSWGYFFYLNPLGGLLLWIPMMIVAVVIMIIGFSIRKPVEV